LRRKRKMSKQYADIAKRNYPDPWNKAMLKNLVKKRKLTAAEYEEITGEAYEA
jgi:hypothetical protein